MRGKRNRLNITLSREPPKRVRVHRECSVLVFFSDTFREWNFLQLRNKATQTDEKTRLYIED